MLRKDTTTKSSSVTTAIFKLLRKSTAVITKPSSFLSFVTSTLYLQATFGQTVSEYQLTTCPDYKTVENNLNSGYWGDTYDSDTKSNLMTFQTNRNPREDFIGDLTVNGTGGFSSMPILRLSEPYLEIFSLSNTVYYASETISALVCNYPIQYSSYSILPSCLIGSYPVAGCLLQGNTQHYQLQAILPKSSCEIINTTFICQLNKTMSPLSGEWQAEGQDRPHFRYDNMNNSLSISIDAYPLGSQDNYTSCAIQLAANATDYTFHGGWAPKKTSLIFTFNLSDIKYLQDTPNCRMLFNTSHDLCITPPCENTAYNIFAHYGFPPTGTIWVNFVNQSRIFIEDTQGKKTYLNRDNSSNTVNVDDQESDNTKTIIIVSSLVGSVFVGALGLFACTKWKKRKNNDDLSYALLELEASKPNFIP